MSAPEMTATPACSVHEVPQQAKGETRTRIVVGLTAVMMVAELLVGWWTHSLALLADGWHMGTHVGALGITAVAYWYARTRAGQTQFAFGTGKVYALAGFTSAGLLLMVAIGVLIESVERFVTPQTVHFAEAFPVAVLGLIVNLVSAYLLDGGHEHHEHQHGPGEHHHHDHNLRAAYLHVVADALTSVLAIVALVLGRSQGWLWADPAMGVVGALVIARWSWGLVRDAGSVLLDAPAQGQQVREEIRHALAPTGDRIEDLHVWQVGPGHYSAIVTIVTDRPKPPATYKAKLAELRQLSHVTVEVDQCVHTGGPCTCIA